MRSPAFAEFALYRITVDNYNISSTQCQQGDKARHTLSRDSFMGFLAFVRWQRRFEVKRIRPWAVLLRMLERIGIDGAEMDRSVGGIAIS